MSNVAHYGGDATSTGREGLQQVRLAEESLPKKLGGSDASVFGPPCLFCNRYKNVSHEPMCSRLSSDWRFRPTITRGDPVAVGSGRMPCRRPATFSPRLGVTPRRKCGGTGGFLTANRGAPQAGAAVRADLVRHRPTSEFVSEFETKRDQ